MIPALLDAVLVDIGGTLVEPAAPGTPVDRLEVVLRPDVVADLAAIRAAGVRLAAVTDTAVMVEDQVRALLEPSGVGALLEHIVTSVEAGAAKPDPSSVREAMRRLGATEPSRVLLVGDDPVDEGAAAAAGIHHVDVAGGTVGSAIEAWSLRRVGRRLTEAMARLVPPDGDARDAASARQATLTKPPGSLGRLEDLGNRLAAMAGCCPPPVPEPAAVAVFAADHGVVAAGVSAWPQDVTAQMVVNLCSGGAAVNVLAARVGATVTVVDVGVATTLPEASASAPALRHRRVRAGTADLSVGAAMSRVEALAALDVGVETAEALVAEGARCLVTGDMGIANTTASAVLIGRAADRAANEVTGRGAGADDDGLARKARVVADALERARRLDEPVDALAEVGGLEIAALAGFVVGGAARRVPVVVDGVIALAALVVAAELAPGVVDWVVAGHRSAEPGASVALDHLGLDPLVDLDLRLGEGTGAVLALPVVWAAAAVLSEMATFEDAGVSS